MDLVQKAYELLYPEKPCPYQTALEYDGHFRGFNGNIRMRGDRVSVKLSRQWESVSPHIQLGLIQELMCKMFRRKKLTINMELYHNFLRDVHKEIPKTESHPVLFESFMRVNRLYFAGLMERPNLRLSESLNPVGTYEYGTDTITISQFLLERPDLLDYVMHHEMLHKKHKFPSKPGRQCHHGPAFKADEARYPDHALLDKELSAHMRRSARHKRTPRRGFFGWL